MNRRNRSTTIVWMLTAMLCGWNAAAAQQPLGSSFTYQGHLEKPAGTALTETCTFEFRLCDDAAAACTPGTMSSHAGIAVSAGVFTVPDVDFGPASLTGDGRWMEVSIECPGDGAPVVLSPRVALRPSPYALRAYEGVGPPSALEVDTVTGRVGIGTNAPGEQLDVAGNLHADGMITSGSLLALDGNSGTVLSNADLDVHISSGRALRLEVTATSPNVILGHSGNSVLAPFPGATISGGGDAGFENRIEFSFGTIGGGGSNLVTGHSSTVAGGRFNIAGADQSTVGGGQSNTARRNSTVAGGSGNTADNLVLGGATVGGGINNQALGGRSTVSGGESNTADDHYAAVPGGHSNQAGGQFSFAAGRRAKVRTAAQVGGGDLDGDEGTFIWADATNADFTSTGPNQFLVRASGGMGLNRNNPTHPLHVGNGIANGNGAHVTAGGTWTNGSSRQWKQNFRDIDKREVLNKLAGLSISQWQYHGEAAHVRHIGPVAEEFRAAFGLGHDEQYITTIDADGVALAAIQGLYDIVKAKNAEIETLRAEKDADVKALRAEIDELRSLLSANATARIREESR